MNFVKGEVIYDSGAFCIKYKNEVWEFVPLIWLRNKLKKEKEYTQILEDDLPF